VLIFSLSNVYSLVRLR